MAPGGCKGGSTLVVSGAAVVNDRTTDQTPAPAVLAPRTRQKYAVLFASPAIGYEVPAIPSLSIALLAKEEVREACT